MKKEVMNIRTEVKNFVVRDRNFVIISYDIDGERRDGAIEDKNIDKNGKLKKALNGFQLFSGATIDMTIKQVTDKVEIDYLTSQGMDKAEAFARVFDLMDRLEDVRKMVNA